MRSDKDNLIVDLTFQFSLKIIEFSGKLEDKKKYVIAKQLLRSGTSVGANVWEAQNAESRADFIHRLKISAKEADETEYWLRLCKYSEDYPFEDELIEQLHSIIKVLSKIIGTSKRNEASSN